MAITVQFRRGTTAENDALTGAEGEILVDTTLDQLRVHDGVTAGGHKVARHVDISDKIQVANATLLINDRMQVANVATAISTAISNLVDAAPSTLDTLNELAAALGDDANFSTTVTNSIASKASWTALTTTNTDIRTLVDDRLQVANASATYATISTFNSALANTNAYIASVASSAGDVANAYLTSTFTTNTAFQSALANTNAYIASVASSAGDVANAYLTSTFTTNTAFQSYVANTNAWITTVEAASGGGGANTSQIESIVDGKIQVLEISDLIGGDGNLGEVLVSNGDGTGYWAPALREYVYTATNNQVTFTGNDVYGTSMSYKPGSIAIFLNGVKLMRSDYQANNGVSIVLNDGAAANDSIEVLSFAGPAVV